MNSLLPQNLFEGLAKSMALIILKESSVNVLKKLNKCIKEIKNPNEWDNENLFSDWRI